jgi:putative sigma-54 modulation protein
LELAVERNPSIANDHIAEATIWTKGPVLRARESAGDHKASIDQLVANLTRQAQRYREKRRDRRHVRTNNDGPAEGGTIDVEAEPEIVKSKQFALKPMSPEEAVLQLELVGHDFFVFRNGDSGEVNVVYRRKDGGYGLIEPS